MDPFARPTSVVEHALERASARRQAIRAARDRRERDMLTALADVERYERDLAYSTTEIDGLLEERARARANDAIADRFVRP